MVLCGEKNGSSMAPLEEPFEAPLFLRVCLRSLSEISFVRCLHAKTMPAKSLLHKAAMQQVSQLPKFSDSALVDITLNMETWGRLHFKYRTKWGVVNGTHLDQIRQSHMGKTGWRGAHGEKNSHRHSMGMTTPVLYIFVSRSLVDDIPISIGYSCALLL